MTTETNRRFLLKNRELIATILLLLTGIGLRLLHWTAYQESPLFLHVFGPDVQEYRQWAEWIISGSRFWPEQPIHAPLYAYFLATLRPLTGGDAGTDRLIQLILGLFIPLLLRPAIRHWEPSWRLLFLGLAWCYPGLIYFQAEFYSENMALLTAAGALGLVAALTEKDRYRRSIGPAWIAAGLLFGLSAIAHGAMLIPAATFLLWLMIREPFHGSGGWKKVLAASLGLALAVLPVSFYNSFRHGYPVIIQTNSGYNFWLGNNSEADGTCRIRPGPEWNRLHDEAEEAAEATGISIDAWFLRRAFAYIAGHPVEWMKLTVLKALYAWNQQELCSGADLAPLRNAIPLQRTTWWSAGVLTTLSLWGFLLWLTKRRSEWRGVSGMMAIYLTAGWLVQTMFVASARYRLIMLPAMFWFAVLACREFVIVAGSRREVLLRWILFGLAAGVVWIPRPPFDAERERIDALSLKAEAWLEAGDPEKAKTALAGVVTACPEWSRDWALYGRALLQQGDTAGAAATYLACYETCHNDTDCAVNYADYLRREGRLDEAGPWYDRAFTAAGKHPTAGLWYNYGLWLEAVGEKNEAEAAYEKALEKDPALVQAVSALGLLMFRSGQFDRARELFERAVRLVPHASGNQCNLISSLIAARDLDRARALLSAALTRWPDQSCFRQQADILSKQPENSP